MKGFFNISNERGNGPCAACGLARYPGNPMLPLSGDGEMGIMLMGAAPSESDDRKGRHWTGRSGRYLKNTLADFGVRLFQDTYNQYAVNCYPLGLKGGRNGIKNKHIESCRPRVLRAIEDYKPKVIIAFGEAALNSLIGHRMKKGVGSIDMWRGYAIPDYELGAWICPTFDPTRVLSQERYKEVETIWRQDLQQAVGLIDSPFPKDLPSSRDINICETDDEITDALKTVGKWRAFAWDIETTGLKPHDTNVHSIQCTAFATSNECYVVPRLIKEDHIALYRKILEGPSRKIAQNMKFEHTWVHNIYGINVQNWWFDTLLGSHQLDNRTGVSGLKFQTLVNFGVYDYDSEVSPFLKAKNEKDSNSTNRLVIAMKSPVTRQKVMLYCGFDALYTYRLAKLEMKKLWR